jgi:hypothetical protein
MVFAGFELLLILYPIVFALLIPQILIKFCNIGKAVIPDMFTTISFVLSIFFLCLCLYTNINSTIFLIIISSICVLFTKFLFLYYDFVISNTLSKTPFIEKVLLVINRDSFINFFRKFKQWAQRTTSDIKVGLFFFKEFKFNLIKQISDDLYLLQEIFFKYTKPRKIEDDVSFTSNEELRKLKKRLRDLVDPTIKFNKLSRLPWILKTDHEDSADYTFFRHFLSIYTFFKTTLISILLSLVYFLYTIFFFKIQFLKQLSVWFVIGMMFFWLISGFNFFLKRYQFGKFTSQIQRFWKRTNTSFWLIEGFLLLIFYYYYLNSSEEPLYMYDYSSLNQEHLVSLYTVGFNVMILSIVIYFMYFTLLRLNSNSWEQLSLNLVIISVFIFFSFFVETYQFYYVISVFNERLWFFNEEDNIWSVEEDNPILRTKTQYFLVCLIAKYWHFLFIFLSWIFFLMKSFEKKKITYVLFGSNLQNIILLFVLNLACYVQWLKWFYRRFFDLPYNWFFTNIDNKFIYKFIHEIKLTALSLFSFNSQVTNIYDIIYKSLSVWGVDSLFLWKFI